MNARIYDVPTSAILINGKRGNYNEILSSHRYEGLDRALKRVVPKIKMENIAELIEQTQPISDIKKQFLIKILSMRKKILLDKNV